MPRNKSTLRKISTVEFDYKRFGQILRVLIKQKGFTQANFAESINISCPYLNNILAGTRRITLDTYIKILDVLELIDLSSCVNFITDDVSLQRIEIISELFRLSNKLSLNELNVILEITNNIKNLSEK